MRSTILTLSMTMVVFSGLNMAQAQESTSVEQAQYQQAQSTSFWQESNEDSGGLNLGDDSAPGDLSPGRYEVRPRYWFLPPNYATYIQADALWLTRIHNPADQPIGELLNGSMPVLSTGQVSLQNNYALGGIFTLGFNLDQVASLEATYFGLNSWSNSAQATADPTAIPPNLLGLAGNLKNGTTDFIFADRMSINYSSQIHNAEGNYKQTIEGLTLLTGFRYFRMAETFDINSHSATNGTASDYKVNAVNQLLGAQFGMGYTWQWGGLNANILGKIGPYANLSHQNTLLQDVGNTLTIRDYRADTTPVSTLAEAVLSTGYKVNDWFSIHAGYRFIWIQNVAFAPDQLDLTNSPPGTHVINSHNHLIMHGVNVGAEIRW